MKNIAEFVKDNYSEIIKNNPPLKDEELIKYIKSNDIKNIVHRDYIILHNLHLILFLIKKHHIKEYERGDFKTICLFGLHKAVSHYNPDKNFSFKNYALTIMEHEIFAWWKERIKEKDKNISIDSIITPDNEITSNKFEAKISAEYNQSLEEKRKNNISILIYDFMNNKDINEHHKRIFKMNFVDNLNYSEIGSILGISRQRVAEINNKNLKFIRKNMV